MFSTEMLGDQAHVTQNKSMPVIVSFIKAYWATFIVGREIVWVKKDEDDVTKDVNCRLTYTELKAVETGCMEKCSNFKIPLKTRVAAFALYILT